jgi:mannose-6-phosphate isomerase
MVFRPGERIMKMKVKLTEKPWGQLGVPHVPQGRAPDVRIGEVAFEDPADPSNPLLIKYLYTSERLSIQVHPNNDQARSLGHPSGKDEMWIVLEAQPGATIGLGLKREAGAEELRAAALNGSLEDLVDWRPVERGDVIYNPAGTIHAAGADLVLLEVQQAIDLTYRLYDYGRPRGLHLTEGLAVANGRPHFDPRDCSVADGVSRLLATGPYFGAAWCVGALPAGVPSAAEHYQLVVVEGAAKVRADDVVAGECCLVRSLADIQLAERAVALLAWPAPESLAIAA